MKITTRHLNTKENKMKTRLPRGLSTMFLIGATLVMAPFSAMAASTPPCTAIDNTATVTYAVGGETQPTVAGSTGAFNVGVKVMVAVAGQNGDEVTVIRSLTTKYALKFNVTNNGSAVQDYDLVAEPAATGAASSHGGANDSFDGTNIAIYLDDGDGIFNGTDTDITATPILENVPADGVAGSTKTVFIVYSPTDLTAANLATAVYYLKATSKWADSTAITYADGTPSAAQAGGACDGTRTISVVAGDLLGPATGDTLNDGEASGIEAYQVTSAGIGVTKSRSPIWDPINLAVSPKFIPGAIVRYSVAIANATGANAAVLSTIVDNLDSNLQIVSTAANATWAVTGSARGTTSGTLTADAINGDGLAHTNPAAVAGTLTATLTTILAADAGNGYVAGELKADETVTVTFDATVQ